jgi:Fe-S-cluster-containing dehydrogenase component
VKKHYVMVIDQERCIGCEACTVACKNENDGARGHIRVNTLDAPHKDTPAGVFPNLSMTFLPVLCNHCEHPPCVDACPLEAIAKEENGVVYLDEAACDGCQTCLAACPYGAIAFNAKKDKAEKCNLCRHRIDEGLAPFCVICCEGQAMYFGDLNDPGSQVSKALSDGNGYTLKPGSGTKPSVYYLPPKDPRGL